MSGYMETGQFEVWYERPDGVTKKRSAHTTKAEAQEIVDRLNQQECANYDSDERCGYYVVCTFQPLPLRARSASA